MCDKRRGIRSYRFRLEDGGKNRIEEITENVCIMVENMLKCKKRVEKVVHGWWNKKNNCA
jgi:hypothetical protein